MGRFSWIIQVDWSNVINHKDCNKEKAGESKSETHLNATGTKTGRMGH